MLMPEVKILRERKSYLQFTFLIVQRIEAILELFANRSLLAALC